MTLKVLLLLSVSFSLGKVQEIQQPNVDFNERFVNFGPSTIHSIKGKFYEEKQTIHTVKPKIRSEDVTKLQPTSTVVQHMEDVFTNMSNTIESNANDFASLQKNDRKQHNSNIRQSVMNDTLASFSSPNSNNKYNKNPINRHKQDVSNKEPSNMHFHTENLISMYDKNDSIEVIKRELEFDSLLIKNNFNNTSMIETPKYIVNSYIGNDINPEADVTDNSPNARRRLPPNTYFQRIPPQLFNDPMLSDNIIPIISKYEHANFDHNLPNEINQRTVETVQHNTNVLDKSSCENKENDEISERSGDSIHIKEPTIGSGIRKVANSPVMLIDHPRVCYACSSINDASCWSPDRLTAVKYCRADHPSCLTKLYKFKGVSYVIRDCGTVCDRTDSNESPKYTTCTICHHDLCNNGYLFKSQNITIFVFLFFHIKLLFSLDIL